MTAALRTVLRRCELGGPEQRRVLEAVDDPIRPSGVGSRHPTFDVPVVAAADGTSWP